MAQCQEPRYGADRPMVDGSYIVDCDGPDANRQFREGDALPLRQRPSSIGAGLLRQLRHLVAACALLFLLSSSRGGGVVVRAQQQDPTTMNGGSVLAMAGKDCVAVAVDKRFGRDLSLVTIQPRRVFFPSRRLLVAFTGLDGDVQSLQEELSAQVVRQYARGLGFGQRSDEGSSGSAVTAAVTSRRRISPRAMASLTSHVLYGRKQSPYFVEPIVAGLELIEGVDECDSTSAYRPFLCSMDVIGAQSLSREFVCGGVASDSLYGTAEALWEPNLDAQALVRVCGKAFLSALERNCLSGYGAMIYLITPSGITEYDLVTRND